MSVENEEQSVLDCLSFFALVFFCFRIETNVCLKLAVKLSCSLIKELENAENLDVLILLSIRDGVSMFCIIYLATTYICENAQKIVMLH